MFTTPCFIKKNTPELRKKLEELGYIYIPNGRAEWFIPIEELKYLVTYPQSGCYKGCNGYWYKTDFDCGTNEELFLALAALRDDTDKNQWLTDGKIWGKFGEDLSLYPIPIINYLQLKGHKATVEELIEHFKNK